MTIPIIPGPWDWLRQLGEAGAKVINSKSQGDLKSYELSQEDQARAQQQAAFMMQMLNSGVADPQAMLPMLQSTMMRTGVGGVTPESIGSYGETIQTEQRARRGKAKVEAAKAETDMTNMPAEQQAAHFKAVFPNIDADARNAATEAIMKLKRTPTPEDLDKIANQAVASFEQRRLKTNGSVLTDQDRQYVEPFIRSAVHDEYLKWFHLQNERISAENRWGATNQSDMSRRLIAQFNKANEVVQTYDKSPTALVWKGYVDRNEPLPENLQKYFATDIAEYMRAHQVVAIIQASLNGTMTPEQAQMQIDQLGVIGAGAGSPTMAGDTGRGTGGQPATIRQAVVSRIVEQLKSRNMSIQDVQSGVSAKKITQAEADQAIKEYQDLFDTKKQFGPSGNVKNKFDSTSKGSK